jgi:uncharacterized protein
LKPIFHLSFPVQDLDGAIAFYTQMLGGTLGRREPEWADIALFGAQLTLQLAPSDVTDPMPRTRHFGATAGWSDWQSLTARLTDFVEPPAISYQNTEQEQAKAMIRDPSGNLIEIKAYRNPAAVLRSLAAEQA